MIVGLIVLALLIGSGFFMIADIMQADSGETTKWSDSWPVQHSLLFGVLVGVATLAIGLLILIAVQTQRRDDRDA